MTKFMQWWLRTQTNTSNKFESILICENNPLSTENKIIKQTNQATWDDLTRQIIKILMKNHSRLYSSYTQLRPTTAVTINIMTSNQTNVWMSCIHKGLAYCKLNKLLRHILQADHMIIFLKICQSRNACNRNWEYTQKNNLLNVF